VHSITPIALPRLRILTCSDGFLWTRLERPGLRTTHHTGHNPAMADTSPCLPRTSHSAGGVSAILPAAKISIRLWFYKTHMSIRLAKAPRSVLQTRIDKDETCPRSGRDLQHFSGTWACCSHNVCDDEGCAGFCYNVISG
jgi:hypothetical protein